MVVYAKALLGFLAFLGLQLPLILAGYVWLLSCFYWLSFTFLYCSYHFFFLIVKDIILGHLSCFFLIEKKNWDRSKSETWKMGLGFEAENIELWFALRLKCTLLKFIPCSVLIIMCIRMFELPALCTQLCTCTLNPFVHCLMILKTMLCSIQYLFNFWI